MVDSLHVNMHKLARRFGLGLLDTIAARPPHARDTCYLDGHYYPMAQADRDFAQIYPIMQQQLGKVNEVTTYANATAEAKRLDAMSMRDWITRYVPGGRVVAARAPDRSLVLERVRSRPRRTERAQSRGAARRAAPLRRRTTR